MGPVIQLRRAPRSFVKRKNIIYMAWGRHEIYAAEQKKQLSIVTIAGYGDLELKLRAEVLEPGFLKRLTRFYFNHHSIGLPKFNFVVVRWTSEVATAQNLTNSH